MAGVAGFEPTNDGVRGKSGISKMTVLSLFKQKNTEFKAFLKKVSPNFPNRVFPITIDINCKNILRNHTGDSLQRFGKVKVEGTSFTVSEPTEKIEIAPHLYELCNEERKKILRDYYNVTSFIVETISLERIFIDKVFAAEFYFERRQFGDVAKHIYDLTVLMQNEQIKEFLSNTKEVFRIVGLKRKEELVRKGGVAADMKVADFAYFTAIKTNKEFKVKFNEMQKIYVFDKNDELTTDEALKAVGELQRVMKAIDC